MFIFIGFLAFVFSKIRKSSKSSLNRCVLTTSDLKARFCFHVDCVDVVSYTPSFTGALVIGVFELDVDAKSIVRSHGGVGGVAGGLAILVGMWNFHVCWRLCLVA